MCICYNNYIIKVRTAYNIKWKQIPSLESVRETTSGAIKNYYTRWADPGIGFGRSPFRLPLLFSLSSLPFLFSRPPSFSPLFIFHFIPSPLPFFLYLIPPFFSSRFSWGVRFQAAGPGEALPSNVFNESQSKSEFPRSRSDSKYLRTKSQSKSLSSETGLESVRTRVQVWFNYHNFRTENPDFQFENQNCNTRVLQQNSIRVVLEYKQDSNTTSTISELKIFHIMCKLRWCNGVWHEKYPFQ